MNKPSLSVLRIIGAADPSLFDRFLQVEHLHIIGCTDPSLLHKAVQEEIVTAIASTLTEDAYTHVELNPRQQRLKALAEDLGYIVTVVEGLEQHPGTEYDPIAIPLRHPHKDDEEQEDAQPEDQEQAAPPPAPAQPLQ
jgi:hypothetical protein